MTESILLFLDISSNGQQVELPFNLDSSVVSLTLKCYDFSGTFQNLSTNYPRYIQIRFSQSMETMSFTNKSGYGREDCVQVPYLLDTNTFWTTPNISWNIPMGRNTRFQRIFYVSFFDDAGVMLSGLTRALLWIEMKVIDKDKATTGRTFPVI